MSREDQCLVAGVAILTLWYTALWVIAGAVLVLIYEEVNWQSMTLLAWGFGGLILLTRIWAWLEDWSTELRLRRERNHKELRLRRERVKKRQGD